MRKIFKQKKLFGWLFWLWGLLIVVLSSLPNIPNQEINIWGDLFRLDYLEHFGIFAIWGGIFIVWKAKDGVFSSKDFIWPILFCILFAAMDEMHQLWIVGRSYNPLDMIYNVLGLLSAFVIGPYFLRWVYKK